MKKVKLTPSILVKIGFTPDKYGDYSYETFKLHSGTNEFWYNNVKIEYLDDLIRLMTSFKENPALTYQQYQMYSMLCNAIDELVQRFMVEFSNDKEFMDSMVDQSETGKIRREVVYQMVYEYLRFSLTRQKIDINLN